MYNSIIGVHRNKCFAAESRLYLTNITSADTASVSCADTNSVRPDKGLSHSDFLTQITRQGKKQEA